MFFGTVYDMVNFSGLLHHYGMTKRHGDSLDSNPTEV